MNYFDICLVSTGDTIRAHENGATCSRTIFFPESSLLYVRFYLYASLFPRGPQDVFV